MACLFSISVQGYAQNAERVCDKFYEFSIGSDWLEEKVEDLTLLVNEVYDIDDWADEPKETVVHERAIALKNLRAEWKMIDDSLENLWTNWNVMYVLRVDGPEGKVPLIDKKCLIGKRYHRGNKELVKLRKQIKKGSTMAAQRMEDWTSYQRIKHLMKIDKRIYAAEKTIQNFWSAVNDLDEVCKVCHENPNE